MVCGQEDFSVGFPVGEETNKQVGVRVVEGVGRWGTELRGWGKQKFSGGMGGDAF